MSTCDKGGRSEAWRCFRRLTQRRPCIRNRRARYSAQVSIDVRCQLGFYQYAAYGSNLHPDRLRRRVSSASFIGTGLLPGYGLKFHKLSRNDGSGKCNIVAGGSGVHIAIFELAESDRARLDRCEGLGFGYDHHTVQVDSYGACATYIAADNAIDDSLAPLDWYKEYVLRGAQFHGFPLEYISALERQAAVMDPDHDRGQREWQSIEKLGASKMRPDQATVLAATGPIRHG